MNLFSFFKNLRIGNKLLSAFAVTVIFMLVIGFTSYNNGKIYRNSLLVYAKKTCLALIILLKRIETSNNF